MRTMAWERRKERLTRVGLIGLKILAALATLGLLLWIILPVLVSTERLGAALRSDLKARNRVDISTQTPPELTLWPSPSLTYRDVTVRQGDGSTFFEADRLSAEFSVFEALSGTLTFSNLRLFRPHFHLDESWRGRLPQTGGDFIDAVWQLTDGFRLGPWPFAQRTFGKLTIREGSLVIEQDASQQTVIANINATLSWPDAGEPFVGSISADVAGKRVRADLTAPQFRRLIAGGDAPMTFTLTLPGATITAEGSASLALSGFFTGGFSLEAKDLPALLSWYGQAPKGMEAMQTARATARLSATNRLLRFEQLAFSINDTSATGILDLALKPDSLPKFTGTLAFADFDIGDVNNLLPLMSQFVTARGNTPPAPAAAFDLRLSVGQVRLGEVSLGNVAASMLIGQDHALIDIGDSDFEDGRLTGRLSSGPKGIGQDMRLQLSVRDIDLARLGERLKLDELWPSGPGSLDVSLASERSFIDTRRPDLSGKATVTANKGHLNRFAASALRALANRPVPFPLAEAGDADFDFDRLDARLNIDKGAVTIDSAILESETSRLRFSGTLSENDDLTLTARLSSIVPGATDPDLAIAIGGPRTAPIITAIGETP